MLAFTKRLFNLQLNKKNTLQANLQTLQKPHGATLEVKYYRNRKKTVMSFELPNRSDRFNLLFV